MQNKFLAISIGLTCLVLGLVFGQNYLSNQVSAQDEVISTPTCGCQSGGSCQKRNGTCANPEGCQRMQKGDGTGGGKQDGTGPRAQTGSCLRAQ